ncbi:MAG TPA: flagellar biosynthesis protein FliP [Rhodospirillales bacterium]|nr:flagellar biosynthesis protein FliP [Rhodospirillales bacterium]
MKNPGKTKRKLAAAWTGIAVALAALALMAANPAAAQSFTLDLGAAGGSSTSRIIQLVLLMTVLTMAPSILIMVTSFTRIVIVLHFVRQAMATQQSPPNQVLVSLALFLTLFIMMPTIDSINTKAIQPLINEEISEVEAFKLGVEPVREFMLSQVREQDLLLFVELAEIPEDQARGLMPMRALMPAFMISEIRRAFEIGFLVFIPFLVIDMVVASVLMSMGMLMLPPIMISLPFKIIFFVLVDGWYMIVGSMVKSFAGGV